MIRKAIVTCTTAMGEADAWVIFAAGRLVLWAADSVYDLRWT